MNSLDPRVNRLPEIGEPGHFAPPVSLDQFGTFEVFVKPKEGKPFQHEGSVHAPDLEMAYVLAKETFTRRFMCVSMFVVGTQQVLVSPMTEAGDNAYDVIFNTSGLGAATGEVSYEIFHLTRRGKQHVHVGTVEIAAEEEVWEGARQKFDTGTAVQNVWAVRTADILFTSAEAKDLWLTLPEKKFRDASDYKGGDKLKELLVRNRDHS